MTDPISLTGTAVGVVSLGIQVCGEIVSYCQAWKGFDDDIRTFSQKADGLRVPLEVLRGLLASSTAADAAISKDVEGKLRHIERVIKRLKQAIDQFASRGSGDIAAIRVHFKKAIYPFRKNSLRDMSSDLDSLQLSLHTILHAFSIQHAQTLISMQQAAARNIHDMNSSIQDIQKQLVPSLSLQNLWQAHNNQVAVVTEPQVVHKNLSSTGSSYQLRTRPNFKGQRKATTKSYSHSVRMLSLAINFTISVTMGSAGLSIAPCLNLRFLRDASSSRAVTILNSLNRQLYYNQCPQEVRCRFNTTIAQFQEIFHQGEATASDVYAFPGEEGCFSIMDYTFKTISMYHLLCSPGLLHFLIECGAGSRETTGSSGLSRLLEYVHLWMGEYEIFDYLIDIYECSIQPPKSLEDKEGLRWFVCRYHDDAAIPDIVNVILQESEYDLKAAIEAKPSVVNDRVGECSLLDLAFGWPRGIQILLQAGADAHAYKIKFVEDTESGSTYQSVKLLLQAGCGFDFYHIRRCDEVENGDAMRSLLIHELIARLKGLWDLAKSFLPPEKLPGLIRNDDTEIPIIFDVWTTQIHSALKEQQISIDPSLQTPHNGYWQSVYHYPWFPPKTLQAIYDCGFRGINDLDLNGISPLMVHGSGFHHIKDGVDVWEVIDQVSWLISKSADPNRLVPRTSSTIAHHLTYNLPGFLGNWAVRPYMSHEKEWRNWKDMLLGCEETIAIIPSAGDGCVCACSPSGCNAISLLLRHSMTSISSERFLNSREDPNFWLREMVTTFILWAGDNPTVYRAVIRFFTFDALGLRHVCCVEEGDEFWHMAKLQERDRGEVEEILDEERLGLEDLESLVAEFNDKFDEMGVPIMEFLQGYWLVRIRFFLLERDPYDEEHTVESRKLGVKLEAEQRGLPYRVSLFIRPKLEEIDEEETDEEETDEEETDEEETDEEETNDY